MGQSAYREYQPDPIASHLIECLWSFDAETSLSAPIFPDGCANVVLVFDRGAAVEANFVGVMTRPLQGEFRAGQSFFGLRIRPGRAGAFFSAPAGLRSMNDRIAPVSSVLATWAQELVGAVAAERRVSGRVGQVCDTLARAAPVPDERLRARPSSPTRAGAALSDRQRRRTCARDAGLPPKQLSAVLRFRRVVSLLRQGSMSLSAIALQCGYCDQSHLNREFSRYAGYTPTEYLARLDTWPIYPRPDSAASVT